MIFAIFSPGIFGALWLVAAGFWRLCIIWLSEAIFLRSLLRNSLLLSLCSFISFLSFKNRNSIVGPRWCGGRGGVVVRWCGGDVGRDGGLR